MLFRRASPRLQPGEVIEVDGHPVRLSLSARSRRISLRLDMANGEVLLVAPTLKQLPEAVAFAHTRASWIAARLGELPTRIELRRGARISVGGEAYVLERAAMRIRPRLIAPTPEEPGRLLAYGEGEAYARAAERALRTEALARLTDRTAHHCARLGVEVPALGLQDARSRWGSCKQAHGGEPARIRYNWRLVLSPPEVLDYVVAHECAHLIEANHSPRFWAVVKRLYGDPSRARSWLKANGAALHAVG
jgi:predicted metal-dependent hydrolase